MATRVAAGADRGGGPSTGAGAAVEHAVEGGQDCGHRGGGGGARPAPPPPGPRGSAARPVAGVVWSAAPGAAPGAEVGGAPPAGAGAVGDHAGEGGRVWGPGGGGGPPGPPPRHRCSGAQALPRIRFRFVPHTGQTALAIRVPLSLVLTSPSDRKSTRLNSSHANISYAVFCLKKKYTRGTARKKG